jgi:hypothetical protein
MTALADFPSSHEPSTESTQRSPVRTGLAYGLAFLIGFACLGATLGTDATPDFKIYHYYNGFTAHHDRSALDIFPAQLQTAYFGGLDSIYYFLFTVLDAHPRALNAVLSIPYALTALLVFLMVRLFVPVQFPWRDPTAAVAAVLGVTGAGALPTLATTMSDLVPAVPLLVAVTAWLHRERAGRLGGWSAFVVGAVAGVSVGLKLTLTPLFVALFVVTALRRAFGVKAAIAHAVALGLGGVLTYAIVDVPWLLHNLRAYGNPLFPYMNQVFRSDLVAQSGWRDLRFMPKTPVMALFYPAYWAFRPSHLAIELDMRDARMLIGCASALLVVGAWVLRRVRAAAPRSTVVETLGLHVAVMFLIAYVLWERMWSIYRYLTVLEPLGGVLLVIVLMSLLGRLRAGWFIAALAAIVAATMATTSYPWWSRARPTGHVYSVRLPPIEPDAMVVLLDSYAYSFLVPAMPQSVRVIGANNNLVQPGSWGTLDPRIVRVIHEHRGPLWGLEYPDAFGGVADVTLRHHRLERDSECTMVDTNIEVGPIMRMCRLKRER